MTLVGGSFLRASSFGYEFCLACWSRDDFNLYQGILPCLLGYIVPGQFFSVDIRVVAGYRSGQQQERPYRGYHMYERNGEPWSYLGCLKSHRVSETPTHSLPLVLSVLLQSSSSVR